MSLPSTCQGGWQNIWVELVTGKKGCARSAGCNLEHGSADVDAHHACRPRLGESAKAIGGQGSHRYDGRQRYDRGAFRGCRRSPVRSSGKVTDIQLATAEGRELGPSIRQKHEAVNVSGLSGSRWE